MFFVLAEQVKMLLLWVPIVLRLMIEKEKASVLWVISVVGDLDNYSMEAAPRYPK